MTLHLLHVLLVHPGAPGLHGQQLDDSTRSLVERRALLLGGKLTLGSVSAERWQQPLLMVLASQKWSHLQG